MHFVVGDDVVDIAVVAAAAVVGVLVVAIVTGLALL